MKTAFALALAIAPGAIYWASAQSVDDPFGEPRPKEADKPYVHQLSKDFSSCPDGHKALKDIPIVYGNVGPLIKKPQDYDDEDRKLAERQKRGEVVFGGDLIPTNPQKFQVTCQTCGYYFDNSYPEELPELAGWTRFATDPAAFKQALSKQLLNAPLINPVKKSTSYTQSTDPKGKNVVYESKSYRSTEKPIEVVAVVRKWMAAQGLNPKHLKRVEDAYAHHTYSFSGDVVSIHIIDDKFWNPGEVGVTVSIDRRGR